MVSYIMLCLAILLVTLWVYILWNKVYNFISRFYRSGFVTRMFKLEQNVEKLTEDYNKMMRELEEQNRPISYLFESEEEEKC